VASSSARSGAVHETARAVASGRVSAAEVTRRTLDRLSDTARPAHALNAVTLLRHDEALAEAVLVDERLRSGRDAGPLAGVPVLVKDLEDVAGLPTTMGSLLFADSAPKQQDSTVPTRLRAAGAVVVGKSNLPEFAIEGFTDNLLFGATGNPWNPELSPGGSSGGSAAAVSAGLVPVATATDGGGSIRIPAAFCGLVGLKPTNGVVGRWPAPDWIDFSTEGPFATTAHDLRLLLTVVSGPVAGDPTAVPWWVERRGRRPERLYRTDRFGPHGPLPDDVAASFDAAVEQFAATWGLGCDVVSPADLWPGHDPDDDWFTLATAEHVSRFGRAWVEESLPQMHPSSQAFMEWGLRIDLDAYLAARRRRYEYVRALDTLLGERGLLLSPTVAMSGWTLDGRLPGRPAGLLPPDVYNTALQNITGHPALSLPAGNSPNGLPFGLQVTAPRYSEDLLLDVAEVWEAAHPWPLNAPGYDGFVDAVLG